MTLGASALHQFCLNADVKASRNECWEWKGYINHGGYGLIRIHTEEARYKGEPIRAHRYAYEQFIGPIPEGLVLDHLCRNRKCVNPYHLEPVTNVENMRRGVRTNQNKGKTHCKHGHELTPANVYTSTRGSRSCKACKKRQSKQNYLNSKKSDE